MLHPQRSRYLSLKLSLRSTLLITRAIVFNSFVSDYELPNVPVSEPESEPESESEPEVDAASTMILVPESQVITTQFITHYLNAMMSNYFVECELKL